MSIKTNQWIVRLILVGVLMVAYFVLFPGDLAAVINPVEQLLRLSQVVSPWLYALLSVALICWTLVRIWGRSTNVASEPSVPPT